MDYGLCRDYHAGTRRIDRLKRFFLSGACFEQLDSGRAKKLLAAFKEGRWRSKISNHSPTNNGSNEPLMQAVGMQNPQISFAFQPILAAKLGKVISYEALLRGPQNQTATEILQTIQPEALGNFDTNSRALAITLAAHLGLQCNLHLNFLAQHVDDAKAAIRATLEAAARNNFDPSRIVLEIDHDKFTGDIQRFGKIIQDFRTAGMKISIDHFGAGRASLNLLEPFPPDMISLNELLVRNIDANGPRQAILRGVSQTCNDLGIDIIAKYIETTAEYNWLHDEGVKLFQGDLLAKPGFEQLPEPRIPVA